MVFFGDAILLGDADLPRRPKCRLVYFVYENVEKQMLSTLMSTKSISKRELLITYQFGLELVH